MRTMKIINVLSVGLFLFALYGVASNPVPQNPQKIGDRRYDRSRLFAFVIDSAGEKSEARALEQYKTCPPLLPERFRRRVKMLWAIDVNDYPPNALIRVGNFSTLSVKYQTIREYEKEDNPDDYDDDHSPLPDVPVDESIYTLFWQFMFLNDTAMYKDFRDYRDKRFQKYWDIDRESAKNFKESIYYECDYPAFTYQMAMSIHPSLIPYIDERNDVDLPIDLFVENVETPYRISDIKSSLTTLYVSDQLRKGRVLTSDSGGKNGLWLRFPLDFVSDYGIIKAAWPVPRPYGSIDSRVYPWHKDTQERSLTAYLSFILQLKEKYLNQTVIMYMSGQMDSESNDWLEKEYHEPLRDSIRSNNYYGYAILREFCENPMREMPTLEKVGTSFQGKTQGNNTLLYLEPYPDSYDIDTIRPGETFVAYEMGYDDYYFIEVVKPVESPIAGPDGYAVILDRTETVYGYMKKSEVRALTDKDVIAPIAFPCKKRQGVINDPDGYVNIRKEMTAQSKILGRIVRNEVFSYWELSGSGWCVVRTQNGVTGYMFRNRITEKTGD